MTLAFEPCLCVAAHCRKQLSGPVRFCPYCGTEQSKVKQAIGDQPAPLPEATTLPDVAIPVGSWPSASEPESEHVLPLPSATAASPQLPPQSPPDAKVVPGRGPKLRSRTAVISGVVILVVLGITYVLLAGRREPDPLPQQAEPPPAARQSDARSTNLAEARRCLQTEKYDCAMRFAKLVLGTEPANVEARAIRDEVGRVLGEARAAVDRCISLKDADCARGAIVRLKAIDSSADEIKAYERAITGIEDSMRKPSPPAMAERAMPDPRRIECETYVKAGRSALMNKSYDQAMDSASNALSVLAGCPGAAELMAEARRIKRAEQAKTVIE